MRETRSVFNPSRVVSLALALVLACSTGAGNLGDALASLKDSMDPEIYEAMSYMLGDEDRDYVGPELGQNATNEDREKETIMAMRVLATALGVYWVEVGHFPPDLSGIHAAEKQLVSGVVKRVPTRDGWGNDLHIYTGSAGDHYTIESYGKDGVRQGCVLGTETTDFDCDICHMDGMFIQWPESSGGLVQPQEH